MAGAGVETGRRELRRPRLVVGGLVASVVVSLLVGLVRPPGTPLGSAGYLFPVFLSSVALAAGVRRIPRPRRRPWNLLLLAMLMYLTGEVLFAALDLSGNDSFPTPVDVIYVLAYLPLTGGLLGLGRQRGDQDRGGLLDAAIVALSATTLFVTFIVVPIAADGSQPALARVVSSAYPMADVLLIFLLARMLTGTGSRTTAFWWLTAGTAATLAADVDNNILQLLGLGDDAPVYVNALWQSFYVGLAAGAWAEAAAVPSEEQPREEGGLTVLRLLVLALAAILPSAVLLGLAVTSRATPTAGLAFGSVLLMGLVVVRIWDLLQQVRRQSALLAALARTDPLTGVANRRTWDHELSRTFTRVSRSGQSLLVALLDLDHFKAYNDGHGHQAGDILLKHAAAAWRTELGDDAFVARWGGEEFAVLLTTSSTDDETQALARIDRLRGFLADHQTCSIGVSMWRDAEPAFDLLRRADEALYRAKAAGRDQLCVAPELEFAVSIPEDGTGAELTSSPIM